jgi:site-specific recombinase XerD
LVKKAFARAGLSADKAHPHTLRHSYTAASIRQDSNSAICKEVLRHANIQTTELYTHLSKDMVIGQGLKFSPLLGIQPGITGKNPSLTPLDNG